MDEKVIFSNPQTVKPIVTANGPSSPPAASRSFLKKLIKIILGLLFLGLVGFVIFTFVLPIVNNNSKNSLVTLNYWGLWEDSNVIDPVIADFQRQNPNIKVNYVKQDIKQYRERLLTRIQNMSGPDVFAFHNTWLPMLSGIMVTFPQDTISKSDFEKSFYKVSQRDLSKSGAIYGIPLGIDTLSLFINKDLFEAGGFLAPDNWIDFSSLARELTVKDEDGKIKTAGVAVGTFGNITHAGDIISLFFVQNGANLKDLSSTAKATSDALSFYTSFALNEPVWDDSLNSSVVAFAKGNLAMYFGYSQDYFTILSLNPDIKLEIHSVPHLPGINTTIASYWPIGVSSGSKNQKEALLFIKFLAQKETAQKLFAEQSKTRAFGVPYGRVDLADLLKDNPIVYPFVSQAKDSVSTIFASDTFDNGLNTKANEYLGDAINSILAGTSAQTATETLSQGVSQVLQQYSTE